MCYKFLDCTTQRDMLHANHFLGKPGSANQSHCTGDRCHKVKDQAPQKHFGLETFLQEFDFC